ncbi:MAG: DMT family transporter [Coriobacteriales bacterium]|nr:DMT family transporter [Coriobacteriales bacterium]
MNRKNAPYAFMIAGTAFIWGMCFVAQRSGMDFVGPFLFNGFRELLGSATLLVILAFMTVYHAKKGKEIKENSDADKPVMVLPGRHRLIFIGGAFCGLLLYVASNAQQVAMVTTSAGKAAFITALYIVLVPIIGIALKHKTYWNTWVSVTIAVIGLYLLCVNESFGIDIGDIVLIGSALFWALHILAVDHYVAKLRQREVIGLCAMQFFVAGLISLLSAPILDPFFVTFGFSWAGIVKVLPEILYAGVLSTGVAFTLAAIGQKHIRPSAASIIMSLEAPFGLLGGVALLGEALSFKEVIGCAMMFIAVLLAQLKLRSKPKDP